MAKAKGQTVKVTAAKPAGKPTGGMVAKLKDFGKNVGERAKAVGAGVRVAGTKAASHVSRNLAAYIAGGAGLAAGTGAMALRNRHKRTQSES